VAGTTRLRRGREDKKGAMVEKLQIKVGKSKETSLKIMAVS
jgi:hypothetical protein